jgi:hypothetical protein
LIGLASKTPPLPQDRKRSGDEQQTVTPDAAVLLPTLSQAE